MQPSTTRGLVNADASLSALGPRGVQADVDATVASRAQPADLDATAAVRKLPALTWLWDVGGPQVAAADGGFRSAVPAAAFPEAAIPEAARRVLEIPAASRAARAECARQPGRHRLASRQRWRRPCGVGVLSDARSFGPGIVAFRSLIGG